MLNIHADDDKSPQRPNGGGKSEGHQSAEATAMAMLEKHGGNVDAAAKALNGTTAGRALIVIAIKQMIGKELREERQRLWRDTAAAASGAPPEASAKKSIPAAKSGPLDFIRAYSDMLLDFVLPGGKRLRDATGGEVGAAALYYLKQAKDMRHKGVWLQLIQKRVPDGVTVGKALDEPTLRELQTEARS